MAPHNRLIDRPTPGPWTVWRSQRPPERLFLNGPNGQAIGMIFEKDDGSVPGFSNAHLAAAAPELVDRLVALLSSKSFDQFDEAADAAFDLLHLLGVDVPNVKALGRADG